MILVVLSIMNAKVYKLEKKDTIINLTTYNNVRL